MATAATVPVVPPSHSHLERLLFAYVLDRNGIDESTIRLAATDLPTVPYLKDAHDTTDEQSKDAKNEEKLKTQFSEKALTELCVSLLNTELSLSSNGGSVKTLADAKENENLLPSIIQKELKLYTDETIQSLKDDEKTYAELKKEISALESKIAKEGDGPTKAEKIVESLPSTADEPSKIENEAPSVDVQDEKPVQQEAERVVQPNAATPSVPPSTVSSQVPPARTPASATPAILPPQNMFVDSHGASPSHRQPSVSTMQWQGHLPPGATPYTPQSGYPVGQHGPAGQMPYTGAPFIPYDPQRQAGAMYSPYAAGQHPHRGPPPMAYYPSGAAQAVQSAIQPAAGHYLNTPYAQSPSQPPQAVSRPTPTTMTPPIQPQTSTDTSKTPDPNTNIARVTTPTPQPLPLPPQAALFNGLFQTPERFAEFMRLRKSLPALATATNSPGTPSSVTRWKNSPKPKPSTSLKRSATPAIDDKDEKEAIPPARSPLLPSPTWPKRLDIETSARIDSLNQFSLADNDIDELAMATPTRVTTARGGMRGNRGGNLSNIWMNPRQSMNMSMNMHEMDSSLSSLKKRPSQIQSRPASQNLDDEISLNKASKTSSVTSKEKHGEEIESRSLSQSPDPIRPAYRGTTLNAAQKRKRAPSTSVSVVETAPKASQNSVGVEETPERVMKLDDNDNDEAKAEQEIGAEQEQEQEQDHDRENGHDMILAMKSLSRVANPLIADLSSHKFAGMFTKPITEREAPGYKSLIYQAQDLKSLRGLISAGTKAVASYIESTQAEDEPSINHVFVPNTEDFRPPKAVVSAAQVECEILRIFANAVMFNPDEKRGLGGKFLRRARRFKRREERGRKEKEEDEQVENVEEENEEEAEEQEAEKTKSVSTSTRGRGGRRGRGRGRARAVEVEVEPTPTPEPEPEEDEDEGVDDENEADEDEEIAESNAGSESEEDEDEDDDEDSDSDSSDSELDTASDSTDREESTLVRDTREMFADVEARINLWREVERQGEERSLYVLRGGGDAMDVDGEREVKEEEG